jgi:hypothetical protein
VARALIHFSDLTPEITAIIGYDIFGETLVQTVQMVTQQKCAVNNAQTKTRKQNRALITRPQKLAD